MTYVGHSMRSTSGAKNNPAAFATGLFTCHSNRYHPQMN